MNFWHLVKIVKTRKWIIIGIVAVTLFVVAIAAPKPTVVYEGTALVSPTAQVMQGGVTTAGDNNNNNRQNSPDRNVILSNLIILAQSYEVYQGALDFLAQSTEEQKKSITESMGSDIANKMPYKQVTRVERSAGSLLQFQDWQDVLEISPVQNASIGGVQGTTTDIIRIIVRMPNGDDAPYVANAVAQAFAASYQEKSREDVRKYAKFLLTSKEEAKINLQKLQRQIAEYKSGHSVISVDAETQTAVTSLSSMEEARSQADSAVREAQAAVNDINAQLERQPLVSRQSLPADMNPAVRQLRDELTKAEADLRAIAQRYQPAHDTYKAAQARISMLKEQIAKEGSVYSLPSINDIHQELLKKRSEAQYQLATAKAKLASASASVAAAKQKVNNLAQAEPGLADLMIEYTQADNTYRMLSEKYAQALVAEKESTRTGSIIPFSWSVQATGPIVQGPSKKALLVYGLVLALVLGIVTVAWMDSIDNRMRNAADVEKLMELPVIGLTPKLVGRDCALPKLTHIYPLSAMAESYKILRTNILFELRDNPFKTLMVATGRPGQGGTTTICNLAIALAQIGKRIILIDADMRRPSLHKFFDLPNEAGLSTLLRGEGNLTDAFQQTEVENLIVMTAGPQPLNPSELLGSGRMQDLVKRLEDHCDLVLFDTPSTIVFSDGPMLASWIDAVVMVVSANMVPRGTESQTRDLLRRAKANILGVVVNRLDPENIDSCHFYSHYYASSAVIPPDAALESGNGKNGRKDKQALPDAAKEPAAAAKERDEENPFPD
ncbi:MAG: polysaccharide biosynthesis tyrosine autokinase [Armatimonadota bacterium]|nr:polysaccharide biosynthesis tyrosine autokinase [bacterium]